MGSTIGTYIDHLCYILRYLAAEEDISYDTPFYKRLKKKSESFKKASSSLTAHQSRDALKARRMWLDW